MASGNNKYAVIGLGQFGTAIAQSLSENGAEVYAFDNEEQKVEAVKDDVAFAVTLEATDKKALLSQDIEKVGAAVVAIGEDFESLLLCCVHLQEIGIKRIIARANGKQQRVILEKVGLEEILSPEDEVGKVVAERLLNPSIVSYLQLPDDYEIVEMKAPEGVVDRTVAEIDLSNKYKLNLVTVKREFEKKPGEGEEENEEEPQTEEHVLGVVNARTVIQKTDTLVVFGLMKDIDRFIEVN